MHGRTSRLLLVSSLLAFFFVSGLIAADQSKPYNQVLAQTYNPPNLRNPRVYPIIPVINSNFSFTIDAIADYGDYIVNVTVEIQWDSWYSENISMGWLQSDTWFANILTPSSPRDIQVRFFAYADKGGYNTTNYYDVSIIDGSDPVVTDIEITPGLPYSYDIVTVGCRAWDNDGDVFVDLYYKTEYDNDWTQVIMYNEYGDHYTGQIPGQPSSTYVEYYIVVTDFSGIGVTSPTYSYVVSDPVDNQVYDMGPPPIVFVVIGVAFVVIIGVCLFAMVFRRKPKPPVAPYGHVPRPPSPPPIGYPQGTSSQYGGYHYVAGQQPYAPEKGILDPTWRPPAANAPPPEAPEKGILDSSWSSETPVPQDTPMATSAEASQSQPENQSPSARRFCEACGAELPPGKNTCPVCGFVHS
ncbi:MAG: hypothetical protein ACTSYO_04995 [Candidatus Ranarchaeia archaeon]